MNKINQMNIYKKFAEKNIRNLWFRAGHNTVYRGHYRFQYTQVGTNDLKVFDLFHDIAHAVDFVSLGQVDRLKQVDFGFKAALPVESKTAALARITLECRTTAKQFILMKYFGIVTNLAYFLKIEKHKLFDIEGSQDAFPDVVKLTESMPLEDAENIDWKEVCLVRTKRDKLLLRHIVKLIKHELSLLTESSVISSLNHLNVMAKSGN